MKSLLSTVAIAATLALSSLSAANAGIVYDESINGDAPSIAGSGFVGANVGTLAAGTNSILGSGGQSTWDDYMFTIGAGTSLVGISLALGQGSGDFGADLYTNTGTLLSIQSVFSNRDLSGPGTFAFFGDALALGPGAYRIDNNYSGGTGSWNYQWDLVVRSTNQVPEPASGLLVALAIGMLGVARRRRSAY
jgi:hypothetical protein